VDPYRPLEVTGDVRRVQVVGGTPTGGGRVRELPVWVPPGYDDPEHADWRYPVLYLNDGQNLFEQQPGIPGEWRVDETVTELVRAGKIKPLIIVGIPNSGTDRAREYLPLAAIDGVEPRADEYLGFLTREVMPRIQRVFRVGRGPENTSIGGASLGAVVSLYAATKRPDLFGAVLLESASTLSGADGAWESYLRGAERWPEKFYVGMGGREAGSDPANDALNEQYIEWARTLDALGASKGLDEVHRRLVIDPDAVHSEDAWAKRFGGALMFLYPAFDW
jgi:enterochelin esterase-like enzyme